MEDAAALPDAELEQVSRLRAHMLLHAVAFAEPFGRNMLKLLYPALGDVLILSVTKPAVVQHGDCGLAC